MPSKEEIWLAIALPDYATAPGEETAYFSKLGGTPQWLHADHGVACDGCGEGMRLVTQMHAPLRVYDRVLYVFGCTKAACQEKQEGWKVLRAMKYNTEYDTGAKAPKQREEVESAFEVDDDWGDAGGGFGDDPFGDPSPFGAPSPFGEPEEPKEAPLAEPGCDPKAVIARDVWAGDHPTSEADPFPMVPLDVFAEPAANEAEAAELSALRTKYGHLTTYDSLEADGGAGGGDEEYEKAGSVNQRAFLKFTKRVSRYPSQVVRWCFGAKPLSIDGRVPAPSGPCPNCGSARVPEAQVLSTSIGYVTKEEGLGKKVASKISFGTITVFTCGEMCFAGSGYTLEGVHVSREPDF